MALRKLASMAHDDEQLFDMSKGMPFDWTPPEYPGGLQFDLSKADLEAAGGEGAEPDASMRFSAMGVVTSVLNGREYCRVEIELTQFAGEDGQFADLERPASIYLCGPELERMDLEADCECGDTIYLIGTARVESLASNEYVGDQVILQVTELSYEDESSESREG